MRRYLNTFKSPFLLIIFCLWPQQIFAEDKNGFSLFNPTPPELMREMSTDRPDTTESAYTVDAGHIQIEMSLIDYTSDGADFEQYSWASSNLKLGLTNNLDMQIVIDPYIDTKSKEDEGIGFGNMQIRFKRNLWGNDSGNSALAIMPFIQIPTGNGDLSNGHVEGGLIVPYSRDMGNDFGLGAMAEADFVRDEGNQDYGQEFLHTITISHPVIGQLDGYLEYAGTATHNTGSSYAAVLGGGLTYGLSDNIQLDCGINFGMNQAADDLNTFTGLSVRS